MHLSWERTKKEKGKREQQIKHAKTIEIFVLFGGSLLANASCPETLEHLNTNYSAFRLN